MCPPGTHAGADGGCAGDLKEWTAGAGLVTKRDHHISFSAETEAGKFVFVAGGVTDNTTLLKSIERAKVGEGGTLAAWESAGTLPQAAGGAGVAVVGSALFVVGGHRGVGPTLRTDVGVIGADGMIGEWSKGPDLLHKRFHGAAVAVGHRVYMVGGLTDTGKDSTPSVEALDADAGAAGAWQEMSALPGKRSHHGLASTGEALYLTGGLSGDPAGLYKSYDDVLRAPIEADGTLGEWATVGQLPVFLSIHTSFVFAGQLYLLGGLTEQGDDIANVWRAPIESDGGLGAWEELPALPKARAHGHQAPVVDGFVFAPGGAINHKSYADVFVGRFE